MPEISVIIPVYNVEEYLCRCVDSVLAQTFNDIEVILVDDGSTDNCPQICDNYQKIDSRVKVLHKKNGGVSDARNAGLDIASGNFIGFVDSDDCISPMMYETLFSLIISNNADIAACAVFDVYENIPKIRMTKSKISGNIYFNRGEFFDNFYPENIYILGIEIWNKLYRSSIFHDVRFPVGRIYEDAFIILDVLDKCSYIVQTSTPLYYYYHRNNSITSAPFSIKNFDSIDFSLKHYYFFKRRKLYAQSGYALNIYTQYYLRNYFAIKLKYGHLRYDFKKYMNTFISLFFKILVCPQICKLKKLVMLLIFISPKTALRLCRKYFPECLYDFMR